MGQNMEYVIIQVVKVLENFVLADTNTRAPITEFCNVFLGCFKFILFSQLSINFIYMLEWLHKLQYRIRKLIPD